MLGPLPWYTRTLFAIVIAAGACILAVWSFSLAKNPPEARRTRGNKPPALVSQLQRLRQALPGNGGESPGGPRSASEEEFLANAYPDTDIPLARIQLARVASVAIKSRGAGAGKNTPGEWFYLGPDSAVYQETQFRRGSYVPSRYVSSGRVTALAIAPVCTVNNCRLWVAAAGGGVWRTDSALSGDPKWKFLTGSLGINAIGSIVVDPNDPSGNTIWVGTGEANISGDSAAGVGLYKSTNGGDTWTGPIGGASFNGRAIGSIAIHPANPAVLYVATARATRGVSSVSGGGITLIPGAAIWGLYRSTNGGATFQYIHNGAAVPCPDASPNFVNTAAGATPCSQVGVRRVALDPANPNIVYASSYGRGVWRSADGGNSWVLIKAPLSTPLDNRPEIAVTAKNGKTRMYVGEGASGSPYSRLFRSDDVATGVPVFLDLTSSNPALPGFGSYNYCTGQCWYDNLVFTPAGYPDIVYLGGSFLYSETAGISNGRAVLLSTDAGVSFTDMTEDMASPWAPNGIHPDQHALVVNPNNPYQFIEGSDGGVVRSDGGLEDASGRCASRGLTEPALSRCRQLLSRVPKRIESMNKGLGTLQFQSLSVSPHNPNLIQGGTQDNGTFETSGSAVIWAQTMWGDGGQSGFDSAIPTFRFHTFFAATPDVNFSNGAVHDWNWIGDRIFFIEPQSFYIPIISDPVVSGTMFAGLSHVWRTKTHGRGSLPLNAFRAQCNEFTGNFAAPCGDWEPLGAPAYVPPPPFIVNPSPATRLTYGAAGCGAQPCPLPYQYGPDRAGGFVSVTERAPGNAATLWAATSTGRVFISLNANAAPAGSVTFRRIDLPATPGRFVSSVHVDPQDPNHAWVSYKGFSASTPGTPGHVFEVRYNPVTQTAAWTNRSYDIGDIPVNDLVRDDVTGDLYAATDFLVARLPSGAASWALAGTGLPNAEVSGLTVVSGARKLYAATHGLGAWSLTLR